MRKTIEAVYGKAKRCGNSARILLPKEWLDVEVYVTPLARAQSLMFDREIKKHRIRNIK